MPAPGTNPSIPGSKSGTPTTTSIIAMPSKYDGSPGLCKGFMMHCSMYIHHHFAQFREDQQKVDFMISLLTGRALEWATALWSARSPEVTSERTFTTLF
ncbi:hypothetical protein UPYG_G00021000, partial [Umbra pygmaea]